MDLFTGKKIADLRKFSSLSQEALAEKLGVSRQAVSKWERGEASPDMDNILALARIFGVSVDDLLGDKKAHEITDFSALAQSSAGEEKKTAQPENTAFRPEAKEAEKTAAQPIEQPSAAADPAPSADKAAPEQPEPDAPAVLPEPEEKTAEREKTAKVGKEKPAKAKREKPVKVKKEKTHYKPQVTKKMNKVPVFILVPLVYILLGVTRKMWHPLWLIMFIIPVYYFTSLAFSAKNRRSFFLRLPVPLVLIPIFLFLGIVKGLWHPAWMIFLILPVYYWIAAMVKR